MLGVGRPSYSGRKATLSVQWQVSEQYVGTWPSTSSITVSSRIRHGTMQDQQRGGYWDFASASKAIGLWPFFFESSVYFSHHLPYLSYQPGYLYSNHSKSSSSIPSIRQ